MTDFAPADDLAAELTADAAWVTELESLADAMKSWSFSNDEYQYVILAIGENDEFVMSLSLTPKSS